MFNALKEFRTQDRSLENLLNTPSVARGARQVLIVLGTLLLAYFFGRQPSLTYVYVPLAAVLAWFIYMHPELGLVSLVVAALVIPFEIGTGTQSPLNAAFLAVPLLCGFWLFEMARNRSIRLAPSSTNFPLIGLVLTATLSFVVGYLPWNIFAQLAPLRAQLGAWAIFGCSAGAFLLTANRIRDIRWLKRMVWVYLLLGGLYMVSRLVGPLGAVVGRFFPYGTGGSLFWVWLIVLATGQALFNHDLAARWRLVLAGLVGITFVVALTGEGIGWTSGWLPPLVGLALLIWFRWPRAALVLGLVVALALLLDNSLVQRYLIDTNQYSILTRGAALKIVLEIANANPLLGVGPANYYFYTPLYPILGYYVRFNSHNNYVDILAQTGLVGMAFFTWWALATAHVGWSLRVKFTDGFARGYIYSCLAGLAASLVAAALGDWFLPFVYNIGINGFRTSIFGWLFLGGLVALQQIAKTKVEAPTAAA